MAVELERNSKKLRTRSPAYPYLDLRSALDKAATLWKAEGRHPAAVNVVMHHWGYKEDSSTGNSSMAALKKYGLIEHDGMGENKQIRLSNLALTILLDENPDSPERTEALRTAAMSPRIHAELWERYGSDLPSDQSLKRYLVLEKSFNEAAVEELLAEYKQTICFLGLNLVQAPTLAPGAFAPALSASTYPVPQAPATSTARHATAAPAAQPPDDPTYDRRQEATPTAFQPPPRAIGPASGTRRDQDTSNSPERRANGRDEGFGAQANPQGNGGSAPRRELGGYGLNGGRQHIERESSRYDQEDFGYDEDGYAVPARNGNAPFAQPEVSPAARFAPRAVAPTPAAPAAPAPNPAAALSPVPASAVSDVEATSGVARKELPVPLDGDRVALVPYPMTEEDFTLLIATLQLWKKRLVRGGE